MPDKLLEIVIEQCSVIEALIDVLVDEERVLTTVWPGDALPDVVERKVRLVDRITVLEKELEAALQARGFPGGLAGLDAAAADEPAVAGECARLRSFVRRANHRNMNNGVLLHTRMEYNRRALAVLKGAPQFNADVYGRNGRL